MSLSLLNSYESDSSDEGSSDEGKSAVRAITLETAQVSRASKVSKEAASTDSSSTQQKNVNCTQKKNFDKSRQRETLNLFDVPPDLARELKTAGYASSDIDIVDIDPTPIANQPHSSSHIPQHALRNNAMRLARHITKDSVSNVARRKHQITALAAEAVALQVAQDALPGASRPGSRMNGKFK